MSNQDHSITEDRTTSVSLACRVGDWTVTATASGPSIDPLRVIDTAINAASLAASRVTTIGKNVKQLGNMTVMTNIEPCRNYDDAEVA